MHLRKLMGFLTALLVAVAASVALTGPARAEAPAGAAQPASARAADCSAEKSALAKSTRQVQAKKAQFKKASKALKKAQKKVRSAKGAKRAKASKAVKKARSKKARSKKALKRARAAQAAAQRRLAACQSSSEPDPEPTSPLSPEQLCAVLPFPIPGLCDAPGGGAPTPTPEEVLAGLCALSPEVCQLFGGGEVPSAEDVAAILCGIPGISELCKAAGGGGGGLPPLPIPIPEPLCSLPVLGAILCPTPEVRLSGPQHLIRST